MYIPFVTEIQAWFTRRAEPKTGHAPRANTPDIHLTPDAPAEMRGIDVIGEELDELEVHTQPLPTSSRGWRSGTPVMIAANGDVSLGQERTAAAAEHLDGGRPDARRTGRAGQGIGSGPEQPLTPEARTNRRIDEVVHQVAAPVRTRGGFTGEDPARQAQMQVAHTIRPFDKWQAEHPGTVAKASQDSPTASRPPERKRLAGGRPSPMGSTPTGMERVGPQRNTTRQAPGAWDEKLINAQPSAVSGASRARGWRL